MIRHTVKKVVGVFVPFFFFRFYNLTGLTKLPVSNFTLVGMAGI
jgi:CIC family chloride channel protein